MSSDVKILSADDVLSLIRKETIQVYGLIGDVNILTNNAVASTAEYTKNLPEGANPYGIVRTIITDYYKMMIFISSSGQARLKFISRTESWTDGKWMAFQ